MVGQVGGHSGVQNHDISPSVVGQRIDRSTTAQEVHDHGWSDVLRVGAHALGHHTVVAGGEDHCLFTNLWCGFAEDAGQPYGQFFQSAQTAQWLGQLVLSGPGGIHGGLIQGHDLFDYAVD